MPEILGYGRDESPVTRYVLSDGGFLSVEIINYGATLTSVKIPDRCGNTGEVTLGFDELDEWLENKPYFGAICGRYCNRISNARFVLDGTEYQLTANDGRHCLHGGVDNFSHRFWRTEDFGENYVRMSIISPDGDQGFPGELKLTVLYEVHDNELSITYSARANKKTIAAFTAHPYFNLRDGGAGSILEHELQIEADCYVPVNELLIPSGKIQPAEGTPFDFRTAKGIGRDLKMNCNQLVYSGGGYDHCWVLREPDGEMKLALTLYDNHSGRCLEVFTTEPGIQVYTGSFLDGTKGRGGQCYQNFGGVAIEAEHFPDSPNQPEFPGVELAPGEEGTQKTVYRFSVK